MLNKTLCRLGRGIHVISARFSFSLSVKMGGRLKLICWSYEG